MPRHHYLTVLALTLSLAACGPEHPREQAGATAPTPSGSTEPATPATTHPATTAEPASASASPATRPLAEVTGVAECDRFLDRYRRCLTQVPEEMRPGLETALQAWEGSWKTMAASPTSRGNLAAMCTRTAENAWAAVARFNCPR